MIWQRFSSQEKTFTHGDLFGLIIPHVKIVSRDWSYPPAKCPQAKRQPFYLDLPAVIVVFNDILPNWGLFGIIKQTIPCHCGYPDGMSPLGRMVFSRSPPSGKPSSLWETFHHDTNTGMAYLYNAISTSIS